MKYFSSALLVLISFSSFTQTLCESGYAGIYPCQNVDLLAHIPPESIGGATTNEVWGWTDSLDGKEYVLLGMSTGVGFFDISNPTAPFYLGRLPSHTFNSTWRTLRTYNNYVFVGSEANGHGLQVFDLTRLRDVANPPETFTEDAYYNGFGRCHTLVISEETGYLYACGTNTYSGGLHIVNIQNPLQPTIAGGYDLNGYTHEAQVVIYDGPDTDYTGQTVAFCYNGSNSQPLTIVDVTDPSDASTISTTAYPEQHYCHQGWLTEDGAYLLMDDETDETSEGYLQTRTLIWDMHDLDTPVFMGPHFGTTEAIDHNQFIIGNLSYQSNYTAGLQILDVTEIADTILKQVAYFDHYQVNNATAYDGQWMSYPFFESGVIPCTDIGNGLFLVQPNFIQLDYESTTCSSAEVEIAVLVEFGFTGPYSVEISGLPEDVLVSISDTDFLAPDTIFVTLSGLNGLAGNLAFEITASGTYNQYSRTAAIEITEASTWYTDGDGDGFGNSDLSFLSCATIPGASTIGEDCNDNDNTSYPGALGTADDVDNNCNNVIDPDELAYCADLDGDNIITINDLFIFNGDTGCTGADCIADINGDGVVSVLDLLILIADFGEICN